MPVYIAPTKEEAGRQAALAGASALQGALEEKGQATIVVATGASQFDLLEELTTTPDINWSRVTAFHLDEYTGLPADHPASFRRYLQERFVEALPEPLAAFHAIKAEYPEAACRELGERLAAAEIDVAFIGIGENGHLAFNDPPADFEAETAYHIVALDEACRRQQLGEGWFGSLDEVPREAVSMTVPQIMTARVLICTVPEARKAEAVARAVEGPITPDVPASILQRHPQCHLFLDADSAAKLTST